MIQTRTMSGRCPACGVMHAACGAPSDVVPIDTQWEVAAMGGPLKKYNFRSASGAETVMKLNEDDAARYGLGEDDVVDAAAAAVGADEPTPADAPTRKGRTAAANKARTGSANKGGAGGGD